MDISIVRNLLEKKLPEPGIFDSGIQKVVFFRRDEAYLKRPQLYGPQIIFLAQGKKKIYLGNKEYIYDPLHYYVQTIPLPLECEAIIEDGKPMMGIAIHLDPKIIGEIMFELDYNLSKGESFNNSLYDAVLSDNIFEAIVRFLKSLDSDNDKKVLAPIFLKEIIYKIMIGENGSILSELAQNSNGFYQVSRIINTIHENYSHSFDIQELAKSAGMSSTAFYTIFKNMTSTSPLQYIKNIRLHKAKELLKQDGNNVNSTALKVGYESYSQFSREYKRCFGKAPSKDM